MSKKAIICIVLVAIALIVAFYFTFVKVIGNRDIWPDLNNTFDEAWIKLGENWYEIDVASWRDYEDDAVQVKTTDGYIYLTHYSNLVLIGGT